MSNNEQMNQKYNDVTNDEVISPATNSAASPTPVKQTEQRDPAAGPLRIDEEELDTDDGYDRLWQGERFSGVELGLSPDKDEVYAETGYSDGIPHGFVRYWYSYPNHLEAESFSIYNSPHGPWREWHANRQLEKELLFEEGKHVCKRCWDEQGHSHGLWKEWHPNIYQRLKEEALYEHGTLLHKRCWDEEKRPHGVWQEWYPESQLKSEVLYKDGKVVYERHGHEQVQPVAGPAFVVRDAFQIPRASSVSSSDAANAGFVRKKENDDEAALLALGPRLTWEEKHSNYQWTASEDELLYSIFFSAHAPPPYNSICYWQPGYCRFVTNTLAQAKAACEIHYATGKWQ